MGKAGKVADGSRRWPWGTPSSRDSGHLACGFLAELCSHGVPINSRALKEDREHSCRGRGSLRPVLCFSLEIACGGPPSWRVIRTVVALGAHPRHAFSDPRDPSSGQEQGTQGQPGTELSHGAVQPGWGWWGWKGQRAGRQAGSPGGVCRSGRGVSPGPLEHAVLARRPHPAPASALHAQTLAYLRVPPVVSIPWGEPDASSRKQPVPGPI